MVYKSKEHRENMEAMAREVPECLNACQYPKKPLQCVINSSTTLYI